MSTAAERQELWARAQDNRRRLDACPGHDFSIDLTPELTFGKRWRCWSCAGEVDSIEKHAYEQGLAHGRAGR